MNSEDFKNNYIGKHVRITTNNNRVFYGRLSAIDDKGNILLYETVAEIPQDVSHPINMTLANSLDGQMNRHDYVDYEGMTEEQKRKAKEQFARNKYYFGPVMINNKDVKKAEIQKKVMLKKDDYKGPGRKNKQEAQDKKIVENKEVPKDQKQQQISQETKENEKAPSQPIAS